MAEPPTTGEGGLMGDWYILDENKKPILCNNVLKRHEWINSLPEEQQTGIGCVVAKWKGDGVEVSTVFLGLDHGFGEGPPQLFETMIFGGEHDEECERYATWDEAEKGHASIVARMRKGASR